MIKRYKHEDYIVDDHFKRVKGQGSERQDYRYTVQDLDELQAKDLVCKLMDSFQKVISVGASIKEIAEEQGFVA